MELNQNLERALSLAKGEYQRSIVAGTETLGGSTLGGCAKKYHKSYQRSVQTLLSRLRDHDIPYEVVRGPRGGWSSARLRILETDDSHR